MKKRTVADIGEFGLIDRLTKRLSQRKGVVCGGGDDCAVIATRAKNYELFTTDMLLEDVHFTRATLRPEHVGYKALAHVISDIAAMGGRPMYAVVAIALPRNLSLTYVDRVYKGIRKCAALFGVSIVGGDTSNAAKIMIAVSLLGEVARRKVIYRKGARVGDTIFVTGTFGGSRLKKHATFMPRVTEAQFLIKQAILHAMIDVSDGLVQDLGHILKASRVGCVLDAARIPISRDAQRIARMKPAQALRHALYDGEDFELLFTLAPREGQALLKKWNRTFRLPLTAIGAITKGRTVRLRSATQCRPITIKGFTHF